MSEVYETITLEFDDNTEIECDVIGVFDMDEQEYIALVPTSERDAEEAEVYFYRYNEDGEEFTLEDIETDEEFEKVAIAFGEAIESEEE